MTTRERRRKAFLAGATAALAQLNGAHPVRNPYNPYASTAYYWKRGHSSVMEHCP